MTWAGKEGSQVGEDDSNTLGGELRRRVDKSALGNILEGSVLGGS